MSIFIADFSIVYLIIGKKKLKEEEEEDNESR
jgi:hypothetical protein